MKKRRKEPTEEQKQAAEFRRAAFRELTNKIGAMKPEERAALAAKVGQILTVAGRPLSPFNSCMVHFQRADCTVVGGFRQWKKAGRSVKKGERGCAIWVPTGAKGDGDDGWRSENPEAGDVEASGERPRFICGYVFDVSQTKAEGEPDASTPAIDDAVEVEAKPAEVDSVDHIRAPESKPGDLVLDGWINTTARIDPKHGEAIALELELCD